jgi:hypothetical protein
MHCRSKQKTSVNVGELLSSRGDDWVEDTENKAATVIKERLIDLIRTTGCKHAENEFNKWVNTFCETTYFCLYDSCCKDFGSIASFVEHLLLDHIKPIWITPRTTSSANASNAPPSNYVVDSLPTPAQIDYLIETNNSNVKPETPLDSMKTYLTKIICAKFTLNESQATQAMKEWVKCYRQETYKCKYRQCQSRPIRNHNRFTHLLSQHFKDIARDGRGRTGKRAAVGSDDPKNEHKRDEYDVNLANLPASPLQLSVDSIREDDHQREYNEDVSRKRQRIDDDPNVHHAHDVDVDLQHRQSMIAESQVTMTDVQSPSSLSLSAPSSTFSPLSPATPVIRYTANGRRFEEQIIAGDGNCGYTALGISRDEAHQLLRNNLGNSTIQKLIEPAAKELLLTDENFRKELLHKGVISQQSLEQFIADPINGTLSGDLAVLSIFLLYENKMLVHPAILQALAELQNIRLFIWQIENDGLVPHRERRYAEYNPSTGSITVKHLAFVNYNHFNLLKELDARTEDAVQSFYNYCIANSPSPLPFNHDDQHEAIDPFDFSDIQQSSSENLLTSLLDDHHANWMVDLTPSFQCDPITSNSNINAFMSNDDQADQLSEQVSNIFAGLESPFQSPLPYVMSPYTTDSAGIDESRTTAPDEG